MNAEIKAGQSPGSLSPVARSARRRDRAAFAVGLLLLIGSLVLMFEGTLRDHYAYSGRKFVFNDDARTWVYHFERYHDPLLFENDYLGEYATACTPIGVRGLYWISGHFMGADQFSKLLPYGLLLVVCLGVGLGAARFGGLPSAWIAVSLCLSTGVLLERMVGGLPRSFGFPILALAAAALVWGRIGWLAGITVAGAALYPACAIPAGMALAAVLLVLPKRDRADAEGWSRRKRWSVVIVTVALSGLVLLPTALDLRKFGKSIRPSDYAAYPEAGPGGRPAGDDQPPYAPFFKGAPITAARALVGVGEPWLKLGGGEAGSSTTATVRGRIAMGIVALAALAFVRLAWKDPAGRRLATLLVAAGAGHVLAGPLLPFFYYPPRYVTYPIPIIAFILVAAAPAAVSPAAALDGRWFRRGMIAVIFGAACLLLVGGRGSPSVGLTVWPNPADPAISFLGTLPKESLIAGWPNTVLDGTPYLAHRRVLLSRESHIPFNAGFADELRRRMQAVIEASFASEVGPLLRLRDEFGVTHFVVGREDYASGVPQYFLPFTPWIESAYERGRVKGFEVLRLIETHNVYDDGNFAVLDLAKLPANPGNQQ